VWVALFGLHANAIKKILLRQKPTFKFKFELRADLIIFEIIVLELVITAAKLTHRAAKWRAQCRNGARPRYNLQKNR
jgi:hypothetical protein